MLKKGLFAIVLSCLVMAVSAHAVIIDVNSWGSTSAGWVKTDSSTDTDGDWGKSVSYNFYWPAEVTITYKELNLCSIPVYIEVGMFAQVQDCGSMKIKLKQVDCASSAMLGGHSTQYPCYATCINVNVRSNFPATLGLKTNQDGVSDNNKGILGSNWTARFGAALSAYNANGGKSYNATYAGTGITIASDGKSADITPVGSDTWRQLAVCAYAWSANLMYVTWPGGMGANPNGSSGGIYVGNVVITVKPTV